MWYSILLILLSIMPILLFIETSEVLILKSVSWLSFIVAVLFHMYEYIH